MANGAKSLLHQGAKLLLGRLEKCHVGWNLDHAHDFDGQSTTHCQPSDGHTVQLIEHL